MTEGEMLELQEQFAEAADEDGMVTVALSPDPQDGNVPGALEHGVANGD